MSDQNAFNHRDLAAIALLCWLIFLVVSLVTYDPADPVGPLVAPFDQLYHVDVIVSPQNEDVSNQCGWWGAFAAEVLFSTLGYGAYYLLGAVAFVDVQMLRRQDLDSQFTRGIGWGLSLAGVTGIAALLFPNATPGPILGSGGSLGALIGWGLESHFATTGGVILCTSAVVGGLLMCTDYAIFRAASLARGAVVTTVSSGRNMVQRSAERRAAKFVPTDVEDPFGLEAEAEANGETVTADAPIRIRGLENELEDEWDEEEWEYEDEAEASDEDANDEAELEESDDEGELEYESEMEGDIEEEEEIPVKTPPKTAKRSPKPKSEREEVFAELNEADYEEADDYELPSLELLISGDDVNYDAQRKELSHKAKLLEKTFKDFGFNVKVVEIETGPVIAQYEIELEAGLRLSKITNLADDIAIALRVPSVRIVAPIPGKNTVGIEVPNSKRQMVRLRNVIEETNGKARKMKIPLFLGQDVSGNPLTADLASLPHLLIAGRTGTGKSVCLNAIISSILMTKRPDEVRMLMIDPKMVELSGYGRLPHLMHPVVTDMKKAEAILAWAVDKMEERYSLLAKAGVRHITSYNQLGEEELMDRLGAETDEERAEIPQHIPFIVIVADEMADLMMTAGKEVEQHIIRLAQKSRAVGIHLILATQKPTVDVITGLIKSNLPARISFQVASRTDSRVVLDEMGAEKLLGNGDMLFLWPGTSTLLRGQGTYLSDEEIEGITDSVSTGEQNFVNELVNMNVAAADGDRMEELRKRDELYESAIEVIVREQRGSCSLLQRALGIGYGRAARLIDFMAEDGIVGNYAGSQAREVMISTEDWERMQGLPVGDSDEAEPLEAKKPPVPSPLDDAPTKPSKKRKPAKVDASFEDDEEDEENDEVDDDSGDEDRLRADGPSSPRPKRLTAASAASGSRPRLRRNRIVLGDAEEEAWDDDEQAALMTLAPPDDDLDDDVIDLDALVVDGSVVPSTVEEPCEVEAVEAEEEEDEEELVDELEDDEEDDEEYEEDEEDDEEYEEEYDEEEATTLNAEEEEDEAEEDEEEYEDDEYEEEEYTEDEEEADSITADAEGDVEYEDVEYEDVEYEDEEEEDEEYEEEEEGDAEELADDEEDDEEYEYDEAAYADECEYEEEEEEVEEEDDSYTAESA